MLVGGVGLVIAGFSTGKTLFSLGGLVTNCSGVVIYFKSTIVSCKRFMNITKAYAAINFITERWVGGEPA